MLFRAEDKLVDFECGVADLMCGSMEQAANWTADAINWLANWSLGAQSFRPGDDLWNTAVDEAGVWLGMAILVMMITFIVGVAGGALLQRPDVIKRTLLATLASLPAFYFSFFMVGQGLQIIDEFSAGILDRLSGDGGFAGMIERLFSAQANWGAATAATAVGAPPVGQMMLVLVVMALGLMFITFAMAFRDFVLMILIAFAPLAFVLLPAKGMDDVWMKRWMSAVTAMALAKPLILGTLMLVMAGFKNLESIWSGAGLSLGIGVVITSFMPILAYSFFQFMGGGAGGDDVGQRFGTVTSQKTQQVVSSAARRIPNGPRGGGGPAPAAPGAAGRGSTAGGGGSGNPQAAPAASSGQHSGGGRPGQGPAANGRLEGAPQGSPPKQPAPASPQPAPSAPREGSRPQTPPRPPRSEPRVPEAPKR